VNLETRRRLWGAELDGRGGVHFRVYAPGRQRVDVVVGEGKAARAVPMAADDARGVWTVTVADVGAGTRYRYRLAGEDTLLADPTSRSQPDGPLGASEVIDPTFPWTDDGFGGIPRHGRVLYELHVGTFTSEGTFEAARARLPELARLGVTVVELMPLGEFAGERGWGYDGVFWFAPYHAYGRPEDLRRFVDDAHRLGLGVILDVVYNHMGGVGNVLPRFSPEYHGTARTEWGDGMSFDEGAAPPSRTLVLENVAYWLDEFHLDGFRFDATQSLLDTSPVHILAEVSTVARRAAGGKSLYLVGENEPQDAKLARAVADGGYGLDALWNDDFHHAAAVALTGHREAYFVDYTGQARELLACARHGFLFQGQRYRWQKKPRGTSTRGLPPRAFVTFLENHDQLANFGLGERFWTRVAPGRLRALTALLLLGPATPLLFQGQEWNASARFAFFAELEPGLRAAVKAGRATFLEQFPRYATQEARDSFPDPASADVFRSCRLDWSERDKPAHARALALHRDLLALRRDDPTLRREGEDGVTVDGAALGDHLLVLRTLADDPNEDRLLVVNLGADREPASISEPLVAPPAGTTWRLAFSTDDPRYGGAGVRQASAPHELFLPGDAAVFFIPTPREDA
jgi:maltooligosyltrehalose trehalohydrolase